MCPQEPGLCYQLFSNSVRCHAACSRWPDAVPQLPGAMQAKLPHSTKHGSCFMRNMCRSVCQFEFIVRLLAVVWV